MLLKLQKLQLRYHKRSQNADSLIYDIGYSEDPKSGFVKSAFFILKKPTPMKKTIITIVTTIVLITSFEKAKGQDWEVVSADFPTINILTGANARLSFGLGRFEIFGQIGQYLKLFEEQMTMERLRCTLDVCSIEERHLSLRFANAVNGGAIFRVTDRNLVILGYTICLHRYLRLNVGSQFGYIYLGYIRRENLSQRMDIELSALLTPPAWWFLGNVSGSARWGAYGVVTAGARLSYEVFSNFHLTMQLAYSRKFSVKTERWLRNRLVVPNPDDIITRNLIDFSIGVHYHIPIFGGQQQAQQRPPRQRVAPHQRALPCPPGQMRHLRSWDRPSSVFNHPTAR